MSIPTESGASGVSFGPVINLTQNQSDSHQAANWALITFLSFKNKDTYYGTDLESAATVAEVNNYTVYSDILSISISSSKSSYMMTAEALLSSGTYNYLSLISPGDHALIWMHNDISQFGRIYANASTNNVASDSNSGLKFVGRVNSVRSIYVTDGNGVKTLRYSVTFKGFAELGTTVFYNPLLAPPKLSGNENTQGIEIYTTISAKWTNFLLQSKNGTRQIQDILLFFVELFLGLGPSSNINSNQPQNYLTTNGSYLIPKELTSILGVAASQKPVYSDILHTIMGVQSYETSPNGSLIPLSTNYLNSPVNLICQQSLYGNRIPLPDLFQSPTLWSILDQNCNNTLNEIYTVLRPNGSGQIVPHFIARQKPFTTKYLQDNLNKFQIPISYSSIRNTPFDNLPRWKIDPTISIGSFNIGTSDATRFNFFQVFGQMTNLQTSPELAMSAQIARKNFVVDVADISRHGTRMKTSQSGLDFTHGNSFDDVPLWTALMSDWFANGHLRLTGTLQTVGIADPVCIGDNLEVAGKLFHIESVQHNYAMADGFKLFSTSFELSQGMLANGDFPFQETKNRQDLNTGFEPGYTNEQSSLTTNASVVGQVGDAQPLAALIGLV